MLRMGIKRQGSMVGNVYVQATEAVIYTWVISNKISREYGKKGYRI